MYGVMFSPYGWSTSSINHYRSHFQYASHSRFQCQSFPCKQGLFTLTYNYYEFPRTEFLLGWRYSRRSLLTRLAGIFKPLLAFAFIYFLLGATICFIVTLLWELLWCQGFNPCSFIEWLDLLYRCFEMKSVQIHLFATCETNECAVSVRIFRQGCRWYDAVTQCFGNTACRAVARRSGAIVDQRTTGARISR